MSPLRERLASLLARIRSAEDRSGRPSGCVELLAVTKGVSAEVVAHAVECGQRAFGENRVQELEEKREAVERLCPGIELRWDLIGPLQSNKVRRALAVATRIGSVDRIDLLERIAALSGAGASAPRLLVQVNVDEDPAKSGFTPEALLASVPQIGAVAARTPLAFDGLMTVGRLTADLAESRRTFSAFAEVAGRFRSAASAHGLQIGPLLSAGMSGDFETAIEEGATQVRLGSALFGTRG